MHIVTDHLVPGEACYGASACPVMTTGPSGAVEWRWVERLFVIRGDAIAKYERDLGPASDFKGVIQTRDLLDGEVSVDEVLHQLDIDRQDTYWADKKAEFKSQSTLIADTMDQLEERRAIIANRSVFGPGGGTHQRNGFSKIQIDRLIADKKRSYKHINLPKGR